MREKLLLAALLMLCGVFTGNFVWADWVQDGGSLNVYPADAANYPSMDIYNGTPYVAWSEAEAPWQIYVKHWNGNAWVSDGGSLRYSGGGINAFYPIIRINPWNNAPYVAWQEDTTSFQVYVKHWNGSSWISDGGSLNVNTNRSATNPVLAFWSGFLGASWVENNAIIVKQWNGSWGQIGNTLSARGSSPRMLTWNVYPCVCYVEQNGSYYQLFSKIWDGSKWTQLGDCININSNQNAANPNWCWDSANDKVYITWSELNGSKKQIYARGWDSDSASWLQMGGSLNVNTLQDADFPSVAVLNGIPYIGWNETNGTNAQIYIKHWNGADWVQDSASLNVNVNRNAFERPSLAVSSSSVYVCWSESDGAINQIYVKHLVVPTNTPTNTPTFTPTLTRTPTVTVTVTKSPIPVTYVATVTPTVTPASFYPSPTRTITQIYTETTTVTVIFGNMMKIINNQINPKRGEQASVRWAQPQDAPVTITIYNLVGDKIITLVDHQTYPAGRLNEVAWRGVNGLGNVVASGIYIVHIKTDGYETYSKCAVVK
jgi:hypothetical protein